MTKVVYCGPSFELYHIFRKAHGPLDLEKMQIGVKRLPEIHRIIAQVDRSSHGH